MQVQLQSPGPSSSSGSPAQGRPAHGMGRRLHRGAAPRSPALPHGCCGTRFKHEAATQAALGTVVPHRQTDRRRDRGRNRGTAPPGPSRPAGGALRPPPPAREAEAEAARASPGSESRAPPPAPWRPRRCPRCRRSSRASSTICGPRRSWTGANPWSPTTVSECGGGRGAGPAGPARPWRRCTGRSAPAVPRWPGCPRDVRGRGAGEAPPLGGAGGRGVPPPPAVPSAVKASQQGQGAFRQPGRVKGP